MSKALIKKSFEYLGNIIPISFLRSIANPGINIPFYHLVSNEEALTIKHLYNHKNVNEFKIDIDILLKYFKPISIDEINDYIKSGRKLPNNSFHLTFDDGFREVYEIIAPILLEKGVPATFFITKDFVDNKDLFYRNKASLVIDKISSINDKSIFNSISDLLRSSDINSNSIIDGIRQIKYHQKDLIDKIANIIHFDFENYLNIKKPYMSESEIQELSDKGFNIGAHSVDHPLYSELNLEEQLSQTLESLDYIKTTFKPKVLTFAFPFNDNNIDKVFFERIKPSVDLCFGTSAFLKDEIDFNLQRFCMEIQGENASKIIRKKYMLKTVASIKDQDRIIR